MASEERLRELEEKYEGYTVYDNQGSKVGKVDDLFVDETDNEEYIGVKMGFLGTKSTLIPTEVVRVNEQDRSIEVSESKDHVKDAPSFNDDDDITADYEERIRSHFGLGSLESSGRGSYGGYSGGAAAGGATGAAATGDEDHGREGDTGYAPSGSSTDRDRESSGADTGYGERAGSTTETSGSGTGEYREQTGSSDEETYDSSSTTASGGTTSDPTGQQDSTTGQPSTTRQTEETETFQEGGRTKIRRRTIIEEVVDADEQ